MCVGHYKLLDMMNCLYIAHNFHVRSKFSTFIIRSCMGCYSGQYIVTYIHFIFNILAARDGFKSAGLSPWKFGDQMLTILRLSALPNSCTWRMPDILGSCTGRTILLSIGTIHHCKGDTTFLTTEALSITVTTHANFTIV